MLAILLVLLAQSPCIPQEGTAYQQRHRDVDEEVIGWLKQHAKATPEQFEAFLREIYSRPAMRARFPHGF